MNYGAIKRYRDETGNDIWVSLLELLLEDSKCLSEGVSVLERMVRLMKVIPFDDGACLFHSMIDKSIAIPMAEIRDGMQRVGWLPSKRDDDMSEPYQLVLVNLAHDVNDFMTKNTEPKKKADT